MPALSHISSVRRLLALMTVLVATVAAAVAFAPGMARAADAATDSDCSTQPSGVPAGYSCTVVYEPNGSSNGTYGEIWYQRDTSNMLHLLAFTTLNTQSDVLLCARTSAPYAPSNTNQQDKCIGNTPSLIFNGPLSALGPNGGQSLNSVTTDLGTPVYWVLHINQGGKTTVGLSTAGGAPTVAFSDSCDTGITVTLGNTGGSGPAVFTLTGDLAKTDTVAAGDTTTETIPVASGHTGSVTVDATGLANAPLTHTFDTSACSPQQQTPSPTADFAHSCELGGIQVTLGNVAGGAPADFTVTYDGAGHAYTLAPGATTQFVVAVASDTTKTVSVTSGSLSKSDTFDATSCGGSSTGGGTTGGGTEGQHAINPAVSFSTACTSGISVVLSNMKLDDTTTDAVTFTITKPSGATEQVTVAADHISKRSYPVAEDTTGTVTVTAPGLAKQTKSYAKNCTSVLGEKVTKTPKTTKKTTVLGEKVTRLPFTGLPASTMINDALLLVGGGLVLVVAGRRRRPRGAHAKR